MVRQQLDEALKTAMRAGDQRKVSTLRLILAALKDRSIAERGKGNIHGLTDDQIYELLQAMIKQRHESIRLYNEGGRPDKAAEEAAEVEIIKEFMPPQMTDDEITAAIADVLEETGATTLRDMGRVMALLRERYSGSMDFAKAGATVKERLS